ncbi:hypothetical protein [Aureimonas phyllosphaerae]|uniref:Uncharacterized protein n=1 Tax=Aureimonas phyllosphaerae TaxID=1166078 RepID=A0A7W6FWM7_9HYPH|nr:hypothetical protein [Aureimonas phyllosphaerae]MBB3938085.1 hypothetical protein [Aureimonas phyllosphaerae]MBB3962092.1 hypothetical protein [Aureimonas phyllosphaerae]SFF56048.1 hypothetical protein SAMN05216566_12836 [Aureimonas phyllosphaerae]
MTFGYTHREALLINRERGDANAIADELSRVRRLLAQKETELRETIHELCVSIAASEGLKAGMRALEAAHPDSPLLQPTGRTLNTGEPENLLFRTVIAPTFDVAMARQNSPHPQESRRHVPEDFPPPVAQPDPAPESKATPPKTGLGRFFG